MTKAGHAMPPEIAALSLDEIAERYIGCFRDKKADWEAFEDARIEGYRRAQHRFIGAGGPGKHDDPTTISAYIINELLTGTHMPHVVTITRPDVSALIEEAAKKTR